MSVLAVLGEWSWLGGLAVKVIPIGCSAWVESSWNQS